MNIYLVKYPNHACACVNLLIPLVSSLYERCDGSAKPPNQLLQYKNQFYNLKNI